MKAVTIPTSSSLGLPNSLPHTSAIVKIIAPAKRLFNQYWFDCHYNSYYFVGKSVFKLR
jgi:hypothetical protein